MTEQQSECSGMILHLRSHVSLIVSFPVTSKSQRQEVMTYWNRWKVRSEGLYIDVVTITVKVTRSTTAGLYFHLKIVLEVYRPSLWPEYK